MPRSCRDELPRALRRLRIVLCGAPALCRLRVGYCSLWLLLLHATRPAPTCHTSYTCPVSAYHTSYTCPVSAYHTSYTCTPHARHLQDLHATRPAPQRLSATPALHVAPVPPCHPLLYYPVCHLACHTSYTCTLYTCILLYYPVCPP